MASGTVSARSGAKAKPTVAVPVVQIKSVLFTIGTPAPIVSGTITIVKR